MDEHAGPGVFFNNNSVLQSGGAGKSAVADGSGAEAGRAQYSIPGILHFLQHEWARFELDRAQWELERAELQAQVAFLHGERKGQENLKKDLVRRIKMLEYALKQERAKYHKLKYGTELNQGDMKPPSYDSEEGNEKEAPGSLNSQMWWKQGRQLLRQYLQEVGYMDTILDVKSQRVKALLGLMGDSSRTNQEPLINGTDSTPKGANTGKAELSDSSAVLEAFKFIESATAEFSDEDDEEDSDGREKTIVDSRTIVRKKPSSSFSSTADVCDDLDTEDALKDFDFLSTSEDMDTSPESRSAGDGTDWEKDKRGTSEAWDVDQGLITKLKEQYRKERKGKKGVKRPNRTKLQDMLANLRENEDASPLQSSISPPSRPNTNRFIEHDSSHTDEVEAITFPPSSGKSFIMGGDDAVDSGELGLGELAGLTIANEADNLAYDITNNKDALRKTWNPKFSLRSHFDAIRGLAFHPSEPVLITASEDHTLKMWNLQKTTPAKKNASLDVEPIYTFRAHRGAVLCVVFNNTGDQCYSGGVDGTIQCWNTPSPNIDPYDSYQRCVMRGALSGHTDAVWGLVHSSAHQRLLSCSADGTVRLWNASNTEPAIAVYNQNKELGVPSSVDLVCSEPAYMVTSFTNGKIGLFNMETQQLVQSLESTTESGESCQINKVLSHPTLPITITAQEDHHIKFYDNNTGKPVHSMVAHLDAVTSLAVDPNGLYLMSGSHDCSIRLWNLESKTCIQEFTAHRKKSDESIHDVAFHPSKCYIASAGADSLAKVFV
ncbi:striatin-like isoform X1 [Tachysurus fulvidraco]|uniref:striatin-like isoform X1 n=1 Tax=Tachysurus fulvidraco TaxID=1234273 RepID=UPI000F4E7344|nr:striatin-like isoform X1 [Tachysurus fulvidraco]